MVKTRQQKSRDLGNAIRQWREGKGISRYELAQRVGISKTALLYIENGRSMPAMHRLDVFAEAIGQDWSALLEAAYAEPTA